MSRPLGEHDDERSRFLSPFPGLTGIISGAAKTSITKAVDLRVSFSYQCYKDLGVRFLKQASKQLPRTPSNLLTTP